MAIQIDSKQLLGRFALKGKVPPEKATELAISALSTASAGSLEAVMMDLSEASLTRRMSVTECHHIGELLAGAGARLLKVAFVTSSECVQLYGFLFTVATNRGLRARTFEDRSAALRWLGAAA